MKGAGVKKGKLPLNHSLRMTGEALMNKQLTKMPFEPRRRTLEKGRNAPKPFSQIPSYRGGESKKSNSQNEFKLP